MKRRQIKRSDEYKQKVRDYALDLSQRYRPEIAAVFVADVKATEKRIDENNEVGVCAPYIMLGQKVVLRELIFASGPAKYLLVYVIFDDYVGLVTIWHGVGSRETDDLTRLWSQ